MYPTGPPGGAKEASTRLETFHSFGTQSAFCISLWISFHQNKCLFVQHSALSFHLSLKLDLCLFNYVFESLFIEMLVGQGHLFDSNVLNEVHDNKVFAKKSLVDPKLLFHGHMYNFKSFF